MSEHILSQPNEPAALQLARLTMAFAERYNKFEVHGAEQIPQLGPALIVSYHGVVPLDGFYFMCHHYLRSGRLIRGLVDHLVYRLPLFHSLFQTVGAIPGQPDDAVELLRQGHLVGVFPGGVREQVAGEGKKYQLQWSERVGFARVALRAHVDIIPVFCENSDEMYKAPFAGCAFLRGLYEVTKMPLVPIVGLGLLPFPVPVRAWVGPPVRIIPGDTPESLAGRTRQALQALIDARQPPAQTLLKALRERFT